MWKLWAKLFGWKYVMWKGSLFQDIARVRITPNGKRYVYVLGQFQLLEDKDYVYKDLN